MERNVWFECPDSVTCNFSYFWKYSKEYFWTFNSNKTGLFEGSFFLGGGLIWPPSYFKKKWFNINITVYNFSNLFRVGWRFKKNYDIMCYILTSLVYLQQGNVKIQKTDENSYYWERKSSYLLNDFTLSFSLTL